MQEQKWNQDGWAFLTWPDSSGWEEVEHMGWENSGRAGWSPELPLDTGLCSWAAFWSGQGTEARTVGSASCLPHPAAVTCRGGWAGSLLIQQGMKKFPSPPEKKTWFLFLGCSTRWVWRSGWDTLRAPGLYLFSEFMAGLLPSRKYKS